MNFYKWIENSSEQLKRSFIQYIYDSVGQYPHAVKENEIEEITDPVEKSNYHYMQYKNALQELARACRYIIKPDDTEEDILLEQFF